MTAEGVDLPVVVVPEGLAYDAAAGRALAVPSFVGETVLKHVLDRHADRRILIAPANRFGAPLAEHQAMVAWLAARGCIGAETPSVADARYIDTWGNAVELRRWFDRRGQWPLGPIVLVAAFRHARRARLCFWRNGFDVASIDSVAYAVEGIPIVPRLFYYNWPLLHQAYETFAWARDRLRRASPEEKQT